MAIFKGTGVAIVTPMHEDGKVNFEKLEEILEGSDREQHRRHRYLWNNRRIFYSDTRRASSDN